MSSRMGPMQSFSSALGHALARSASSDVLAAKAARASKVKRMWRDVVTQTCGANGKILLDHTNAVYIVRENSDKVLIVYVDESIFAAELNAHREMIKLKLLERFGEEIKEFRICISRGRYKENYPFRTTDECKEKQPPRAALDEKTLGEIEEAAARIPDERVRKALKKAMISDLEIKSGINLKKEED